MLTIVQEAVRAYREGTDEDIRQQEMEANVMEEQSDPKIEEWVEIIQDHGNTRGWMMLYQQALHVYWVLKRLLAKALEQVAGEVTEIAQGMPNLKKEMKNMQVIMIMQDNKLDEIQQWLAQMAQMTQAPTEPMASLANVDLITDDRKE